MRYWVYNCHTIFNNYYIYKYIYIYIVNIFNIKYIITLSVINCNNNNELCE